MGTYADIKSRKLNRVLEWLVHNKGIEVTRGGKHNKKVTCIRNGKAYPLPLSHKTVTKYIVKDFVEWLVKNEVCTEQEFDDCL